MFIQTRYSTGGSDGPGEPQVSSLAQILIGVRMRHSVLATAHQRSECRLQDSHTQHYTVQTPESLFWLPPLNINCIAVRNLCHPVSKDWVKRGLWVCISPSCRGLCRRCERYGNVCWETLEQVPVWSPAPAHRALLAPATIQIFLFVKNISMFE